MTISSRDDVRSARRIVVKVGSSSISGENSTRIRFLVEVLAEAHGRGADVILVSSGAIATGVPLLGLKDMPSDLATQQAAAAVGQNALVHRYQEAFSSLGVVAGQILLTAGDMESATSRGNAQRAMTRLLEMRVIPIVNENDTVATHEIRFGDNDQLAARVAILVGADLLVLLSDVDALYTRPPHEAGARRVDSVSYGDALESVVIGDVGLAGVGRGGAASKVSAARLAADHGTPVLFTGASLVDRALTVGDVGTWFGHR